jgi:hypothetical protein
VTPLSTKKIRQLTITNPNDTDWKPFIDSHERNNDPLSATANLKDDLTTKVPLNKELLKLAEAYRKQLPQLMDANLNQVRTFFLEEIAPLLLSTSNGLSDAKEVLAAALEEEPAVANYFSRIEKAVDTAVEVRILNFVISLSKLDNDTRAQFLLLTLTRSGVGNELGKETLSHLFSLLNLQKSGQGTEVPMREVPKAKGRRVNSRAGRA